MRVQARVLWTVAAASAIMTMVLVGQPGVVTAAEKEKPAKQRKAAKADRSGTAKVESTKASAAAAAAKSKTCFGEAPKIQQVKPDEGKPGTAVTITGQNFGAVGCLTGVSFGPGQAAKFTHANDSTVTATVPAGKKGMLLLTVTTASGEDSKPFLVK
ncbi:MAG: IPT/TIG domain-containing protein [Nitrospirota bacterium]